MLKTLVRIIQKACSQSPISQSLIDEIQDKNIKLPGEERAGRPASSSAQLRSSDDWFKLVLRKLWDELVRPVIDVLDIKVSQYLFEND